MNPQPDSLDGHSRLPVPRLSSVILVLYVQDQERSTTFYRALTETQPTLHVPGMTEFHLMDQVHLGLMPEKGIAKLITPPLPHPENAHGIPRCELYLRVADPAAWAERALEAGATPIRELQVMDWHEEVVYVADPDGHVLGFARRLPAT